MEYISADEFLKQNEKVQEVFWDWWKPSKGDINYSPVRNGIEVVEIENNSVQRRNEGYIPLLTESQLRRFIENKTRHTVTIEFYKENGYDINLEDGENIKESYENLGHDLLQAYWKVAVDITKQC